MTTEVIEELNPLFCFRHSLVRHLKLSSAQLFDLCRLCQAAAADHDFQQSTQTSTQRTTQLNISYVMWDPPTHSPVSFRRSTRLGVNKNLIRS